MTEKTAWSHLPNAQHIDRVIASVKDHPDEWSAAQLATRGAAWDAARAAAERALGAPGYVAWDAAWYAAWDAVRTAAGGAAWGAVAALVACDDCAHYLDMTSDQLRVWAILSEKPAAVLLLRAVVAFEKISELELV